MDFSGKNVWVTGAGKGIGYATALAFVEAGAKVTGFDQAFTQEQYPFATEVMDVADAAQVAQVCQRLLAETERLDALVNAAGILRMGATDQLSKEDWQQTFAVNVGGAFNLFQQTMNQFRRQRGGAIVTVASDAAHTPRIGMSAYGASKAALREVILPLLDESDEPFDDDNLIDYGLDSVRMMALAARWRKVHGDIDFVMLAKNPTIDAWWKLLSREVK